MAWLALALTATALTGCLAIVDPPDGGAPDDDSGAGACALPAGRYTLVWRLLRAESQGACTPISPGEMDADDRTCAAGCTCAIDDTGDHTDCVRTLSRRCTSNGARNQLECSFPHDGDGTPFGGDCTVTAEDAAGRTIAICAYDMTATRVRQ